MKYDMDSKETKVVYDKWVEKQRGADKELKEVLEKWKNTTRQKIVGYDKWIFMQDFNSGALLVRYYLMRGDAKIFEETSTPYACTEFDRKWKWFYLNHKETPHTLKKLLLEAITNNFKTYIKELERELDPNSNLA